MMRVFNHGLTRMRGANACAFVRTDALRQFKKSRALAKAIRVIRGLILAMVSAAMAFTAFAAEPTVSVTAKQRYPWNGLVDIAFTITGESSAKYDTSFTAKDVTGGTNLTMKTIYKSDGSSAALTNALAVGSYKWVWNAAADLPGGFVSENLTIVGRAVESGFPVVSQGLVAWWPFNGDIKDHSGNGHHLSGIAPTWVANKKGTSSSAASFSGSLTLSQTTDLGVSKSMSFTCWASPSTTLNIPKYIGINLGCGNFGIDNRGFPIIILPGTGNSTKAGIGFSVATDRCDVLARANDNTGTVNDPCLIMDCAVALSGWHHIAITISNNGAPLLFVDGVKQTVKSTTVNGTYYLSKSSTVGGGTFASSEALGYGATKYKGILDELCVYNRALSQAEISTLYNSGK